MEYNTFPSDYYFKLINTKKDYDKLISSGAAHIVGSAIYKTR